MDKHTVKKITLAVMEEYEVTCLDLLGGCRIQPLAFARQVAMSLCYEYGNLSSTRVGVLFGGRCHGTVLHARKVVTRKLETDEEERIRIKKITVSLND